MKHYTIVPVQGEICWENVPWLYAENHQWEPVTDIRMGAQICYSETGLHLHLRTWEKDIRAELTGLLDPVCDDSCMEFFFSPVAEDPRYFNIEMNPNCCMYLGFGTGKHDLLRLTAERNNPIRDKRANRLEDGWELFYTVPLTFVQQFFPGYTLEPGRKLRANVYKCGDLTKHVHYITWNAIESVEPEFHLRGCFGEMELG